jgi:hypothetical protein
VVHAGSPSRGCSSARHVIRGVSVTAPANAILLDYRPDAFAPFLGGGLPEPVPPNIKRRHALAELTLAFPETHQSIGYGMGHLDRLHRAEAYATLRVWLS